MITICALFGAAVVGGLVQGVDDVMTSTTAFAYPGGSNVGYPSYELSKSKSLPGPLLG